MSKFLSFTLLFATFFAVTAEEFDPRDYVPEGYNCMDYCRIMPDNPMLAYHISQLVIYTPFHSIDNLPSETNLAPTISDIVSCKLVTVDAQRTSCTDAHSLYYSKDGLAAEHYDFMKKSILKIPHLRPKEESTEQGIRVARNGRESAVLLSDNFIYINHAGTTPILRDGIIAKIYPMKVVKLVSSFAEKNQVNKEIFKEFKFNSDTIFFSIVPPDLFKNPDGYITHFTIYYSEGKTKIPDYVKYIASAISYNKEKEIIELTITLLCDTEENATKHYTNFSNKNFPAKTKAMIANFSSIDVEYTHGTDGKTLFLKASYDAQDMIARGKKYYDYQRCNQRIHALKNYIDTYVERNEGLYPLSIQQLDIQNFIPSPELLICPANGQPYIYLASGETKASMEKYDAVPIVMDRDYKGNHFMAIGNKYSRFPFKNFSSWKQFIDALSFEDSEKADFIRKKLVDYEKIDINPE